MLPVPYLEIDGEEIANANRTLIYVARLLGDKGFDTGFTGRAGDPNDPQNLACYCEVTSDTDYQSPSSDPAPWYDASDAASGEFLGLYAFSIALSPVAKRAITERTTGAVVGSLHASSRTIAVTGYLYATSARGMVFGEDWLQQQLAGVSPGCSDDILTVLRSCDESAFADLHEIGLVDGPLFTQVGTIPDCNMEQVFFQVVAGWPYLIGPTSTITSPTGITSGIANRVCGTITGAAGKTTAGKLTIVAGTSAVTGLEIFGEPCAGYTDTYCLAPHELMLTADLRWVACGDLREGDELFAFEEHALPGQRNRRWQKSIVTRSERAFKETVLVTLENGDQVECSADHPWLANRSEHHPRKWVRADALMDGPHFVSKLFDPWDIEPGYDAGWLAGMLDGEGCLMMHGVGTRLSMSQKPGLILDLAHERLEALKFRVTRIKGQNATQLHIGGGFHEVARALGSLRPARLLQKFRQAPLDQYAMKTTQMRKSRVLSVEPLGMREVQSIATTTGTYIGAGYAMHNSDTYDPYLAGSGTLVDLLVGTLPAGSTFVFDGITHTATLTDSAGRVIGGLDLLTPSPGCPFAWPEVTNGAVMCLCVSAGTVNGSTRVGVEAADRSL